MSETVQELYESIQELSQEELQELYAELYSGIRRSSTFDRRIQHYPEHRLFHGGIWIPPPLPRPPWPPRPDPGPPDLPPLPPFPDPFPPWWPPDPDLPPIDALSLQQGGLPIASVTVRSNLSGEDADGGEILTESDIVINTTDDSEAMTHANDVSQRAGALGREIVAAFYESRREEDGDTKSRPYRCECKINVYK